VLAALQQIESAKELEPPRKRQCSVASFGGSRYLNSKDERHYLPAPRGNDLLFVGMLVGCVGVLVRMTAVLVRHVGVLFSFGVSAVLVMMSRLTMMMSCVFVVRRSLVVVFGGGMLSCHS
jgi:hypothetical protein